MTFFLILLLIVGIIIWGFAKLNTGKKSNSDSTPLVQDRHLFNLVIGDIVQYELRDWSVETVYLYESRGFEWREYLLRDAEDVVWLCVEEDDWLEVSWLTPVPQNDVALQLPLRDHLLFDGVSYNLVEKGKATFRTLGRVNEQHGNCQFYDYKSDDSQLLSIESFGASLEQGGDVDLCIGRLIRPTDLSLLPGDGRSIYSA